MSLAVPHLSFDWPTGLKNLEPFLFQIPHIVVAVDNQSRCVFFNQGASTYFGPNPETHLEQPIENAGLLGSILQPNFEKVLSSKEPIFAEHEIPLDNKKRTFEAQYRIVAGNAGQSLGAIVALRDVSDTKRRELELVEAERRYEAQTQALNVFDIVAETDRRGQITYVNDKFIEISKYSREELLGQDHRILNSRYHGKSFFKDLWATITKGNVWAGEIRNRAKDGSYYWVSTVITPVLEPDGRIKGFLSVRRDITKQKQAEEGLRESELRFRELLDNVSLIAVGLNLQGRVTFVNDALCRLLDTKRDKLLGLDWFSNFIPEEQQRNLMDIHSQILVNEDFPRVHEAEIVTPSGRRLIAWHNTVFRNSSGDVIGVTSLGEDITRRRTREKEIHDLQERNEAQKEQIVAFVSHELRSPLVSVRLAIDSLQKQFGDQAKDVIDRAIQHLQKIERVSRDLLESSLHRATDLKFEPEVVHLNRLLAKTCQRFEDEAKAKNFKIQFEDSPVEIVGRFDPARLDQVFTNLLSNAIKYSKPDSGPIVVSIEKENDQAHIIISDSGVGIPKENLDSIFELFSRAENVKKSKVSGFGLGLKIAKDIVERHEGKIWAESELGKGSKFHILLPLTSS